MVQTVGRQPLSSGSISCRSVGFSYWQMGQVFLGRCRSTVAPFFVIHISLKLCSRKNRLHGAECLRSY